MSISALLQGCENRLRSSAVLNDSPSEAVGAVCGVQPDGSPPPNAGQFYYAIWFAGLRNDDLNALSLDEFYAVTVTITAKMAYAPKDRRGARMSTATNLLDRAIAVRVALHQDDTHRIEANKLIAGTAEWAAIQVPPGVATVNGFLTPLKFQGIGPVKPAPSGWAGTDGKNEMYCVEVKFVDAHRPQLLGS